MKKIDLDLTQINTSVNQEIKVSAMKNFDFYDGKDKLEIIDKLLGSKVSHLTLEKNLLKENIIVRNVLQHRAGIVSQEDLQRLGVKAILEDHGNTNKLIATNQKVTRTAFDMEKITDAMINLALTLVP